jgi:hypothetical protein
MCSYTFDKVATLPGYSLNSDKDKCGEKLRRAGLAELRHFLEESDAREHPWESVIDAKPARANGRSHAIVPMRPSSVRWCCGRVAGKGTGNHPVPRNNRAANDTGGGLRSM